MPAFDKTLSKILESSAYPEFKKRLQESACPRCEVLRKSRTHIVVDRGNPEAPIMVIGEAPGADEDEQGLAFVGRAGKSFDQAMHAVGLDTNRDMFIANVVKCRPPGNRPPSPAEAAQCRPYLEKQIQLVRPRLVVLLGATALRRISPENAAFSMRERAGTFFDLKAYPGVKFMVLYHPAAVFYNRQLASAMAGHAKKLREFISGLSPNPGRGDKRRKETVEN